MDTTFLFGGKKVELWKSTGGGETMPVARPEASDARIIAHVDMDCFYVQVEQRKQPELRGKPTAVVQYNSWQGGGLIAVGYEARKDGVKRSMRGDEAKEVCPQINLVQVPVARGKADLNIYRNAGSEVVSILSRRGRCERASIDEVYLDLTEAAETMLSETPLILDAIDEEALKSHVLGLNEDGQENVREWFTRDDADHRDKLLAFGAIIVAELRMQVLKETEFTCSAGIAHNKMLAKLASAMNKPAQQTIVPFSAIKELLASLPVKKMKQLGGKLGSSLQSDLGVGTVGDLLKFSEEQLQERYGINTGTWLWNIARGISGDEVEGRLLPKSHGCGKTFPGPQALKTIASVKSWLNDLSEELSERIQSDLDQNKRVAHTLTLHARVYKINDSDSQKKFPSKSCPLRYGTVKIQEDALKMFESALREFMGSNRVETQGNQNNSWGVTGLSVSASKILATPSGTCSILRYFNGDASCSSPKHISRASIQGSAPLPPSGNETSLRLDQTELPKKSTWEETSINSEKSNSYRDEERREKGNYEEAHSISRFFNSSDPLCSTSQLESDGIIKETVPFLASGHENSLGLNQAEVKNGHHEKESMVNRPRDEQKRGTGNEKGTCSILKFFHTRNPSCSSSQQEFDKMIHDTAPSSSSGTEHCSDWNHAAATNASLSEETRIKNARPHLDRDEQRNDTWRINVNEIDPSVIDELPPEIQDEVRGWLRPLKAVKTSKRGSSIAHYFSPVKKA